MFSKSNPNTQPTQPTANPSPAPSSSPSPAPQSAAPAVQPEPVRTAPRAPQKGVSTIGADMVLEGDISGGGEIQIDGVIKGDVRIEHVTVGDGGQVEGGIYAEAVEVRGRVSGSITAKQVRLYGACHVDGDITHEQLAMETGAFFQGRSLRLQRPTASASSASASSSASSHGPASKPPEPASNGALNAKPAPSATV